MKKSVVGGRGSRYHVGLAATANAWYYGIGCYEMPELPKVKCVDKVPLQRQSKRYDSSVRSLPGSREVFSQVEDRLPVPQKGQVVKN